MYTHVSTNTCIILCTLREPEARAPQGARRTLSKQVSASHTISPRKRTRAPRRNELGQEKYKKRPQYPAGPEGKSLENGGVCSKGGSTSRKELHVQATKDKERTRKCHRLEKVRGRAR